MGLTLLYHAHMPLKFWMEAFPTAVHLINLLPSSSLKSCIPFELLYHKQPNYSILQPFDYACSPYLHPYHKHKVDFILPSVFFLVITTPNLDISACIHQGECTYLDMCSSILVIFPIPLCFLLPFLPYLSHQD